jgi:hypothetical protein
LLTDLELSAGGLGHDARRLDAQHTRERDAAGQAEAGVQFGAVEPERLDADEHPARLRRRHANRSDREGLGASNTIARMVSVMSQCRRPQVDAFS